MTTCIGCGQRITQDEQYELVQNGGEATLGVAVCMDGECRFYGVLQLA